jgi:hypothetical protein
MSGQSPSMRAAAEYALAESRELQRLTDDLARVVATQLPARNPKPPRAAGGVNTSQ